MEEDADEEFRGLLVQARAVADGTTPLGVFSNFTSNTEISACTPAEVGKHVIVYSAQSTRSQ